MFLPTDSSEATLGLMRCLSHPTAECEAHPLGAKTAVYQPRVGPSQCWGQSQSKSSVTDER